MCSEKASINYFGGFAASQQCSYITRRERETAKESLCCLCSEKCST